MVSLRWNACCRRTYDLWQLRNRACVRIDYLITKCWGFAREDTPCDLNKRNHIPNCSTDIIGWIRMPYSCSALHQQINSPGIRP